MNSSKECAICMHTDYSPDTSKFSCTHTDVVCTNCASKVDKCPLCRGHPKRKKHEMCSVCFKTDYSHTSKFSCTHTDVICTNCASKVVTCPLCYATVPPVRPMYWNATRTIFS